MPAIFTAEFQSMEASVGCGAAPRGARLHRGRGVPPERLPKRAEHRADREPGMAGVAAAGGGGANPGRAHLPVIKTNRRAQPNQPGPRQPRCEEEPLMTNASMVNLTKRGGRRP